MVERSLTRRAILRGAAAASLAIAASQALPSAGRAAEETKAEGPKALFNGKDLTGWDGDPKFWSVKDGAITGITTVENPTPKNTFIIWRGGTLKDFELRLMFRLEAHNSGVQYRSKERAKWVVGGYQADMDEANTYTGMLYEEGGRGIVCRPGQKVAIGADGKPKVTGTASDPAAVKAAIKQKDWNELVIAAQGNHLVHKVNGIVTADVTDDDEKGRAMEGILALQLHAGKPMQVQFKDLALRTL
jgi:hypothetical protein